jgi:hypothetical protein
LSAGVIHAASFIWRSKRVAATSSALSASELKNCAAMIV